MRSSGRLAEWKSWRHPGLARMLVVSRTVNGNINWWSSRYKNSKHVNQRQCHIHWQDHVGMKLYIQALLAIIDLCKQCRYPSITQRFPASWKPIPSSSFKRGGSPLFAEKEKCIWCFKQANIYNMISLTGFRKALFLFVDRSAFFWPSFPFLLFIA